MEMWKDFLVEYAKFPFPEPDESRTVGSTRTSSLEVDRLDRQWKADYAIRDDALFQKLCDTLDNILGDAVLPEGARGRLLAHFSPALDDEDDEWRCNRHEADTKAFLNHGFFAAARIFLKRYGPYQSEFLKETPAEGASSMVNFVMMVDDKETLLVEAKSPSVMAHAQLPVNGMVITWDDRAGLTRKIFMKVALYLAQRKLEWLFLTSHNYWIVFRLVSSDNLPFLAYSPKISIYDSSVPFLAFLGAVLSVVKEVPVSTSVFNPNLEFDVIEKEGQDPSSEEGEIEDDSGTYRGSSNNGNRVNPRITRSYAHNGSELMITSSSPKLSERSRTWVHLHALFNNTLALPQFARNTRERHVWLTRVVGSGSTGNVWECHFNGDAESFALKVAEVLRRSDADRRKRLRHEFGIYQSLENVYASGQLRSRIAPRCYGAFEGDYMDVLILDLCDGMLNAWDELDTSEQAEVYRLVQDLHSVGIMHGDLEPRNILRVKGGGLLLADFSESYKHACKESKVGKLHGHKVQQQKCSELQALRSALRQPLQAKLVNV